MIECASCGQVLAKSATVYIVEGPVPLCAGCCIPRVHAELMRDCPDVRHNPLHHLLAVGTGANAAELLTGHRVPVS